MKLQLSVFAEGLVLGETEKTKRKCFPYAVIETATTTSSNNNAERRRLLGRTETLITPSVDPDWAKIFILDDFQLGKSLQATVIVYNSSSSSNNNKDQDDNNDGTELCRATFDIGTVLGMKGGVMGKETKCGSIIMMHVERCEAESAGILEFQLNGHNLKHREGNNVDPFFEIQRRRKIQSHQSNDKTTTTTVWDCVYRSKPVIDNRNPQWDWGCLELSVLCDGDYNQKFRIAIKDFDEHDKKPTIIGYVRPSVNQLLSSQGGQEINVTKKLKDGTTKIVGTVVVVTANVTNTDQQRSRGGGIFVPGQDGGGGNDDDDDEDEIIVEATDEMDFTSDSNNTTPATFADYCAGGCELRAMVAIDFTASNGDPRKESSLHYFSRGKGMNDYEKAISSICTVLAEFDSDQKFPVVGFGARRKGDSNVSHCFPCSSAGSGGEQEDEVDGVVGILDAYRATIKGGIAMSKPTDITHVIKKAGEDAKEYLKMATTKNGKQQYGILTVFTNGNIHNKEETIAALRDVADVPLSIVVIGVGPSEFDNMKFLNEDTGGNGRVVFVDMKESVDGGENNVNGLAEQSLKAIPDHLVNFFSSKSIQPNPPIEPDEIVIEPFVDEEGGGGTPAEGETTESTSTESTQQEAAPPPDKKAEIFDQLKKQGMRQAMRQGKRLLNQQKRKIFGRRGGRRPPTNQQAFDRLMDQQVNKLMKMFK